MARLARVVLAGFPHHVLQRGVRSMALFTTEADRVEYLRLLAAYTARSAVEVWAWCLMTNHVHLVLVPHRETALAHAIGEAHRRYTRYVNFREGVRGHLFQERFHSFPIQEDRHLLAVVRYVECNPVRARMVQRAVDHPWSSAQHHATGAPDRLVRTSPIRQLAPDWAHVLQDADLPLKVIRRHVRTGRPWGTTDWVRGLEQRLGRPLLPRTGG
ncbi:MAG: transposase [Candidatus Omnitrophica bacterium]|nr:transposase [Candidatus Omnitrophota bacterium]